MKNEIKSKGIIFSGEMIRQVLAGRKTQTRRIIKTQPTGEIGADWAAVKHNLNTDTAGIIYYYPNTPFLKCPYGKIGDELYVKETYLNHALEGHTPVYFYRADDENKPHDRSWKSGRFMPKDAARIFLKITNIRVERACEISEEDAKAEGVLIIPSPPDYAMTHKDEFKSLWSKINGADTWQNWVWVLEFEVISTHKEQK